jgi:hypothetical protein
MTIKITLYTIEHNKKLNKIQLHKSWSLSKTLGVTIFGVLCMNLITLCSKLKVYLKPDLQCQSLLTPIALGKRLTCLSSLKTQGAKAS